MPSSVKGKRQEPIGSATGKGITVAAASSKSKEKSTGDEGRDIVTGLISMELIGSMRVTMVCKSRGGVGGANVDAAANMK